MVNISHLHFSQAYINIWKLTVIPWTTRHLLCSTFIKFSNSFEVAKNNKEGQLIDIFLLTRQNRLCQIAGKWQVSTISSLPRGASLQQHRDQREIHSLGTCYAFLSEGVRGEDTHGLSLDGFLYSLLVHVLCSFIVSLIKKKRHSEMKF